MKPDDLKALIANASVSTKHLNTALVAGLPTAQPQQAVLPQPVGGDRNKKGSTKRRRVCITVSRCRLLDPDNAVGGIKFLIDALRYGGHIAEDTGDHIALEVYQRKVTQKCKQGTEIIIT